MIKVIAFDLVGVLVSEKVILLTKEEALLERMFGPNINNDDYIDKALGILNNDADVINVTKNLINKIYKIKDIEIFRKLKDKYKDIKIIIATNHLSYVREFIINSFETEYLDDIIISADINMIKPNRDFYFYILDKFKIKPSEMLFLDDNYENIEGSSSLGIPSIKVGKTTNLFDEICNNIEKNI